jgi:hypothetical protein
MKTIAYILFVLQGISIFGGISSGSFSTMISQAMFGGVAGISQLLGYFLPTIIGIILIRKHNKKHGT